MFRKYLNPENDLMITLSEITDILFLSIFWLLGSALVITAGPATAALYDAVYHGFRLRENDSWHRFLRSFRSNFKTGLLASIPVGAILAVMLWAVTTLLAAAASELISWTVFVAACFAALLLIGVLAVIFPMLSRFEAGVGQLIGNSFRLALANLPRTAALAAIHGLTIFACVRYVLPLLFLPALCMLVSTFLIEPMFRPYLPEADGEAPEARPEENSGEITNH